MRTRGFVALVAAGLVFAACGGSSTKSGSGSPTVPTTTVVTAPDTAKQIAADKATVKAVALHITDLPVGYKSTPPGDSSDDVPPAVLAKFAACVHVPKAEAADFLNNHPDAKAPTIEVDFAKDEGSLRETDFENDVELDRSSVDISRPFDLLGAKRALPCWQELFHAAFTETAPKNATVGALEVTSLPIGGVGDRGAAFRATVSLTTSGITVPVSLDFYFVGRGRAGISLFGSGIGHAVDPALERALLRKVVGRLDAANGGSAAP
jgi:hypothetical protein